MDWNTSVGLVLECIDYRFIEKNHKFLKDNFRNTFFDHFSLAGSSLGFNNNKNWRRTCIDNINLAIKLHNIKKIVILEHSNCGAYIETYNDLRNDIDKEKLYHIANIKKCVNVLKRIYPGIKISGYYLSRDQDEHII
jgi:hypothetical protein